jgi:hypothetical protein
VTEVGDARIVELRFPALEPGEEEEEALPG